jgi:hypothetical protein
LDLIIVSMFIGWLTCIPAVLLPHSLRRFTTANAPANRQMPIALGVSSHFKKEKKYEYHEKSYSYTITRYIVD